MSGTLAAAAVTATIKYLLLRSDQPYGLRDFLGGALAVSTVSPDRVPDDATRLNVFLHRATPNTGWSTRDLPSRDTNGDRTGNPFLALDLHYLVTAHATGEFQSEALLAYAMQVLHETPVLARDTIREALRIPGLGDPPNPLISGAVTAQIIGTIAAAGLADQVEQLRIAPCPLSAEELSHHWSTLQVPYRATAAYIATVVLIRRSIPSRQAPPVRSFAAYAVPLTRPVIAQVVRDGGGPILAGSTIIAQGEALRADTTQLLVDTTRVRIGDPGWALAVENDAVRVTLPDALRAGVHTVQVAHPVLVGTPPGERRGVESNVAAFVLQPRIDRDDADAYRLAVIAAADPLPRRLRATVVPPVEAAQRATVYLNQVGVAPGVVPASYAIEAVPRAAGTPPVDDLDFALTGVLAGDYLVRVQVDGAESPLDHVEPQGYVSPRVTL
ncbi:MAG: DUF4255 domain-containing protein [Gemmatimonadaceae bacterium]|nr:DUF4255 domain-containing protein [Gemmatimonadaceae bacterium]